MAENYESLSKLSMQQLKDNYDNLAKNTSVGTQFYLDEIKRRESDKLANSMHRMTIFITILTVVNVGLVAYTILCSTTN